MANITKKEEMEKSVVLKSFFDNHKNKLLSLLPKHIDIEKFISIGLNAVQKDPNLLRCDPYTLFKSFKDAAECGLYIGGHRQQACIVAYYNEHKGVHEAQFQPMYQGLMDLVRQAQDVEDIRARIVYEKDYFNMEYGANEKLEHRPHLGDDPGKAIGCYAVMWVKGRKPAFEYMTKEEILKIREKSQAHKSGYGSPWTDPAGEYQMWKKTLIKRLMNTSESSTEEMKKAIYKDDVSEYGEFKNKVSEIVEAKTDDKTQDLKTRLSKQVIDAEVTDVKEEKKEVKKAEPPKKEEKKEVKKEEKKVDKPKEEKAPSKPVEKKEVKNESEVTEDELFS